MFCVELQ